MIRVLAVVLLALFLSACYRPLSIQVTQHDPDWTYDNDPNACLYTKGKALLPC